MAGIILAGGRSRRMGRDKALLPYAGTSLLDHVSRRLLTVVRDVIVIAAAVDKYGGIELAAGVRVIGDLYPGEGPLGGIVTGLRAAGSGAHFVMACDMPTVQPELIALLSEAVGDHDAALPEVEGRLQPLCAVYHQRCADKLESLLLQGERSVNGAVRDLDLAIIHEDVIRTVDPDLVSFTNLNTQDDYRKQQPGISEPRRAAKDNHV